MFFVVSDRSKNLYDITKAFTSHSVKVTLLSALHPSCELWKAFLRKHHIVVFQDKDGAIFFFLKQRELLLLGNFLLLALHSTCRNEPSVLRRKVHLSLFCAFTVLYNLLNAPQGSTCVAVLCIMW